MSEDTRVASELIIAILDDPCYITDFVYEWFPAVLDQFVGGAAQDVCTTLGACSADNSTTNGTATTCDEGSNGLHDLSKWLESEEQVVEHVRFLQEGLCAGDGDCVDIVAENYPDMNKHATQNFIVPDAIPVLCDGFCSEEPQPNATLFA